MGIKLLGVGSTSQRDENRCKNTFEEIINAQRLNCKKAIKLVKSVCEGQFHDIQVELNFDHSHTPWITAIS